MAKRESGFADMTIAAPTIAVSEMIMAFISGLYHTLYHEAALENKSIIHIANASAVAFNDEISVRIQPVGYCGAMLSLLVQRGVTGGTSGVHGLCPSMSKNQRLFSTSS